jgi:hypothetical protein
MATHTLVTKYSPPLRAAVSGIVVALGVCLSPAVALACPFCATRSGGSVGQSVALGVFLLLPFVVAGVVYSVLRSEAR